MSAPVAYDRTGIESADAEAAIIDFATSAPDDPARARLRERAIEAWLPFANRLARRYRGRGESFGDLSQVAVEGLIKAIDRYEADRGLAFPSYAIPTITGELKRHFRDRTWFVHVPRRLQELWLKINAAGDELTQRLGHAPTVTELAGHLGLGEDE